jgi:hypothetical protein
VIVSLMLAAMAGALKVIAHPRMARASQRRLFRTQLPPYRAARIGRGGRSGGRLLVHSAGVAAATGLVLLLTGAVIAHVCAKDSAHAALPALACGVLAGTVIALAIVR